MKHQYLHTSTYFKWQYGNLSSRVVPAWSELELTASFFLFFFLVSYSTQQWIFSSFNSINASKLQSKNKKTQREERGREASPQTNMCKLCIAPLKKERKKDHLAFPAYFWTTKKVIFRAARLAKQIVYVRTTVIIGKVQTTQIIYECARMSLFPSGLLFLLFLLQHRLTAVVSHTRIVL